MPKKLVRTAEDAPRSVVNDPRFSSMHNAPIFKKIQKDNNKIKVDERFQSVLTDDRFRAVPGAIDIYGRKTKKGLKSSAEKELNSFYQIDDSVVDEAEEVKASVKVAPTSSKVNKKKGTSDGQKTEDPETRLEYLNRLARGDVSGSSSDDSDDVDSGSDGDSEDSDDEGVVADERSSKGPLDITSDMEDEDDGEEAHATSRLAIMNCDWDNLKAQDLMSVMQSFCPPGKTVEKVIVYPSDFGKERMANEATHGPPKIWTGGDDDSDFEEAESDDEEEDDEDEGYDGIEAIDVGQDDAVVGGKKRNKWKAGKPLAPAANEQAKEKVSKSERKGDFKRLPGTVGIVLQDDLVIRGKNRGDDADDEEEDLEDEEGETYFDRNLSKDVIVKGTKGGKGKSSAKDKGKREALQKQRFTGAGKGDEDGEGGFDEVALRAYELSKLKYYFAVAELCSVETAETLMAQLDGVELGHSSMVFDLRYIPEDTSFEDRVVRDQCSEVGGDYQPPDFVVNALQHTTVQCSWDEGEKDRERKLTNISQWRQLQESELLQYVASSDSDDDDEEEEEEEEEGMGNSSDSDSDAAVAKAQGKKSSASSQRKQSAANLRRLLLGGGSDNDFSEDSDDDKTSKAKSRNSKAKNISEDDEEEEEEEKVDPGFDDDFFTNDGESDEKIDNGASKVKKGKVKGGETDMVFTYVPDAAKQLQDRKKDEQQMDETPFETMQRKLAEKKKARKAAKKLIKSGQGVDTSADKADVEAAGKGSGKKGKVQEVERAAATKAELELLLSDDDEGYDMRALHKQEQEAIKGPKAKRKGRSKKPKEAEDAALLKDSTSSSGGDFQLDLQDSRFARLLEGDSSFGIDRTSSEFKETKAMKQIFGEQRSRREKEAAKASRGESEQTKDAGVKDTSSADNVDSLVSKLKRKYSENSSNKSKSARL